jgi:hypothetical protein
MGQHLHHFESVLHRKPMSSAEGPGEDANHTLGAAPETTQAEAAHAHALHPKSMGDLAASTLGSKIRVVFSLDYDAALWVKQRCCTAAACCWQRRGGKGGGREGRGGGGGLLWRLRVARCALCVDYKMC